jgi:hypothetical protein
MGRFLAALVGVIAGFVIAHLVNRTPQGREFFARSGATIQSFIRGFKSVYRP